MPIILLYIDLSLFDIIINTCESKSLESVKVNNNKVKGKQTMSLKDKLNIKQATKPTSNKKSSIEDKLHKLIYSAIDKAIKDDKELSKYYNDNLTIDTYVQDTTKDEQGKIVDEVKLVEVRNARAITIPIDNVKLTQGEETHTINKALKVGEVQVYFKGIKKQVAEFVPTPKNNK